MDAEMARALVWILLMLLCLLGAQKEERKLRK